MNLTGIIDRHDKGLLISSSTKELKAYQGQFFRKIEFLREVTKQGTVATEVYADIRKYEAVHDEISRLIEDRTKLTDYSFSGKWIPLEGILKVDSMAVGGIEIKGSNHFNIQGFFGL